MNDTRLDMTNHRTNAVISTLMTTERIREKVPNKNNIYLFWF